jgi:hypothetical protein
MSLKDFEAFIRERLGIWDPTIDVTPGSPVDSELIQPLLSRIGTDPFATNLPLFMRERLAQEFPENAVQEGYALSDIVVKPMELLSDPLVREINRVSLVQSFRDPSLLSVEEAEALAANLFSNRKKGTLSSGTGRAYFSSPRSVTVNPADYMMSKTGYLFYPTEVQSIRQDEMIFNTEGSLYYFDITVQAENPGDQYNISPDELVSIANVPGVVRVTNKRRFRKGTPAEKAVEFIGRSEQELSEKSLVAIRGITSKINKNFPEVLRMAIVGHSDPEMDRDVLKGGGFGPIIETGIGAAGFSDGKYGTHTTRIRVTDDVNFTVLIGPVGGVTDEFALTVHGAFDSGTDPIQDLTVTRVVDTKTLEVQENTFLGYATDKPWALRKRSIIISSIPGGILFPDGPNGTVEVSGREVHIGGCTDIYIKTPGFTENTLSLDAVSDDQPAASGTEAYSDSILSGYPLVLADFEYYNNAINNEDTANYLLKDGDPTYELLKSAVSDGYVVRITAPSAKAGTYKVTRIIQDPSIGSDRHPILVLDRDVPAPYGVTNTITWMLQDDLDVDLIDPKETRWSGTDLRTFIGSVYVDTQSAVDFDDVGVAAGDTLRILNGRDAGDYVLAANPQAPGGTRLQLSQGMVASASDLSFTVFRANQAGGMDLPLIRVTSVDLLDSGNQPVGSTIPYGKPVFCRSNAFSNPSRGTKLEVRDGCVGIVGRILDIGASTEPEANVAGKDLLVRWRLYGTLDVEGFVVDTTVQFGTGTLPSPRLTLTEVVDQINAHLATVAQAQVSAAHIVNGRRLGISPLGPKTEVDDADPGDTSSAYKLLFGTYRADLIIGGPGYKRWTPPMTSRDVRSDTVSNLETDPAPDDEWDDDVYDIDRDVDGLDLLEGNQVGHYLFEPPWDAGTYDGTTPWYFTYPDEDIKVTLRQDMNPEADKHIRVGARSIGTARVFFLEPVTIEFGPPSRFSVTIEGIDYNYFPDSSLHATRIPAHPSTAELKDISFQRLFGSPLGADIGYIDTTSENFYEAGTKVGDMVVITLEDLIGSEDLPSDVPNLADTILVMSVDNGPDINIQFLETSNPGSPLVGRDAIADQINDKLGTDIASIILDSISGKYLLSLSADVPITIRYMSGSGYANSILGMATSADQNNTARQAGTYLIRSIPTATRLLVQRLRVRQDWVDDNVPQHASIVRPGTQRFSSTLMDGNVGTSGLYYIDIELASLGIGDPWNISADLEMSVSGYISYGYHTDVTDPSFTFSVLEKPFLRLPPIFFPVGTSDDVRSAITVVGQNVLVNYETTSVIDNVQDYVNGELDRVTCSNLLIRHLKPHFVRLDIDYTGGSKASVLVPDMENYINGLYPDDEMQADDVQKLLKNRGATYVANPINLIAVVYDVDRSIWLDWSNDAINAGRLAAFIPDVITLTRRG